MVETVPIPAVNAAIIRGGKILLTRRSKLVREPGKWCLPGGHIEHKEDWRGAIRREVEEEVGLKVLGEKLIGIYSDPSLTVTQQILPGGFHGQFIVALFQVATQGEVIPNEEVDAWNWIEPLQLPSPMLRSHPIRIADAFAFKGEVFVR